MVCIGPTNGLAESGCGAASMLDRTLSVPKAADLTLFHASTVQNWLPNETSTLVASSKDRGSSGGIGAYTRESASASMLVTPGMWVRK